MRILLLSQWFEPEPTPRGLVFAKALAARGHDVEVLTGFPNYPGGRLYPGYNIKLRQRQSMEGFRITRTALYPSHDNSATGRVANYVSFALTAATVGAFSIQRPDVTYVYHPPATIAFPAIVLNKIRKVPFVLDILDLWPDTLAATRMVGSRRVLGAVNMWCHLAYRSAAVIAVPSPGFKRVLVERGVPADKIEVIYHWCNESAVTQVQPDAPILKEAGFEGRFNVVFAGTMGRAQALSSVLHAARLIAQKAPRIQFVMIGGGIAVSSLRAEADEMALHNVKFLPVMPAAEIGPLLAAADVLLVHLRDDPLFSITIPSKTQAYMAAGRPILMAVHGDAAAMVRDAGAGVCVNPEDPVALAAAVCELSSRAPGELAAIGERGREYYLKHLSLSAGVDRFEALFRRVVLAA